MAKSNEAKQREAARSKLAFRLRVAIELVDDVWRDAGCPLAQEKPLRDIERLLIQEEAKLLGQEA